MDFIVGETFGELGEAMIALEAIKEFGKGTLAWSSTIYAS